jgi:hypothetical protein
MKKHSFLIIVCIAYLWTSVYAGPDKTPEPDLPDTTFGMFKREHASFACEHVKAASAGLVATAVGATAAGTA